MWWSCLWVASSARSPALLHARCGVWPHSTATTNNPVSATLPAQLLTPCTALHSLLPLCAAPLLPSTTPPPPPPPLQAEMARLSQLGDILGMSMAEVSAVHGDLAEQAYRSQVSVVMV